MILFGIISTLLPQHVGDLGNIEADDNGKARFRFTDGLVKVNIYCKRGVPPLLTIIHFIILGL